MVYYVEKYGNVFGRIKILFEDMHIWTIKSRLMRNTTLWNELIELEKQEDSKVVITNLLKLYSNLTETLSMRSNIDIKEICDTLENVGINKQWYKIFDLKKGIRHGQ